MLKCVVELDFEVEVDMKVDLNVEFCWIGFRI